MMRLLMFVSCILASTSAQAATLFDEFPPFFGGTVRVSADVWNGGYQAVEAQDYQYAVASALGDSPPGEASVYVSPNHLFGGMASGTSDTVNQGNIPVRAGGSFEAEYVDQFRMIADPGSDLPKFVQINFIAHGFLNATMTQQGTNTYSVHSDHSVSLLNPSAAAYVQLLVANGAGSYDSLMYRDIGTTDVGPSQAEFIEDAVSITLPVVEVFRTSDGYAGGVAALGVKLVGGAGVDNAAGTASVLFDKTLQLTSITLPEYGNQTPLDAGFQVALASGLSVPVPEPGSFILAGSAALVAIFTWAFRARRAR